MCTISLGSDAIMLFQRRPEADGAAGTATIGPSSGSGSGLVPVAEVLLRRRSAVVFQDDAYARLLHSIPASHGETVGQLAPCLNGDPPLEDEDAAAAEADGRSVDAAAVSAAKAEGVSGSEVEAAAAAVKPESCASRGAAGAAALPAPGPVPAALAPAPARLCVGSTLDRGTRISITLRHVPLAPTPVPATAAASTAAAAAAGIAPAPSPSAVDGDGKR